MFAGLWKRGPEAWSEELPHRYFERTARNQAAKLLKRRARHVPMTELRSEARVAPGPRTDELVVRAERTRIVLTAVEELPERCRKVMRLVLREELSNSEIAARLGISVRAVEKQKERARRLLREALEGVLDEGVSGVLSHGDGGVRPS